MKEAKCCGIYIDHTSNFCPNCGEHLENADKDKPTTHGEGSDAATCSVDFLKTGEYVPEVGSTITLFGEKCRVTKVTPTVIDRDEYGRATNFPGFDISGVIIPPNA